MIMMGSFIDGIVEDLITELSMVKEISVATEKPTLDLGVRTIHLNHLKMSGVLILSYHP